MFLAHIRNNDDSTQECQPANTHCRNTAEIAQKCLSNTNMEKAAYLSGVLHDMGKYKTEYQDYLRKASMGEEVERGSVIHTFAGVKYILDTFWKPGEPTEKDIISEMIAYVIGAHHGLFDIEGPTQNNGFLHRINSRDIGYEESRDNFLKECLTCEEIDRMMEEAVKDTWPLLDKIINKVDSECTSDEDYESERTFYFGLVIRMILSAVIEGDRIDTARFMNNRPTQNQSETNWNDCLLHIEAKLERFDNIKPIDKARKKISDLCKEKAKLPSGTFRLNVPTGGGKTLSSLRFAVAHAKKNHKKRIIFVVPLLTILEQNASVIREYIGNDDMILEHHSNVVQDKDGENQGVQNTLAENWNAPIIITTLVQLLDTFFAGKTSNIRRFHALVNSIVVIDEVQTVPIKMLSLFQMTVNFLTEYCGTTIVMCSATQPAFEQTNHHLYNKPIDIVPYEKKLWEVFRRTEIKDGGSLDLDDIPKLANQLLINSNSCLIICNKKKEASDLYNLFIEQDFECFHLSAAMCMAHRRDVLEQMTTALMRANTNHKVICISTQIIEAGVDVSFGAVVRISAGMDSIVQSAGRCNRNAEYDGLSPVNIVSINNENLNYLTEIRRGQTATRSLLVEYNENPQRFGNTLNSDEAINFYYEMLYNNLPMNSMDFTIENPKCTLFDLMGRNVKFWRAECEYSNVQAFATAGRLFNVFDENSIDVVVPYGKGVEIVNELLECMSWDYKRQKELIQKVKPFVVTVYSYQQKKLEEEHGITWVCGGSIAILSTEYYSLETGFVETKKEMEFLEV